MSLPTQPSAFSDADHAALLVLTTTGALLCAALVLEHAFAMDPCPLCMMQRIWVAMVGLITLASLVHNSAWGIYPLGAMVAAVIGGGFSIRQIWLQHLPADQVPACGPDLGYMLEAFPLSEVLSAMTRGTGDCAEVDLLFGVSLPIWVLLAFVGLFILAVRQFRAGMH